MSVQEVKQKGEQAADELKQKGEQAVEQVQGKAQQAASKAEGKLRQQVDQRSQQVAEEVETTAQALRKASEELRNQGNDQPAKLIERGAEKADQVGRYLKESNAEAMLHDVEDMARKKPWAAVAGGAAVGFAFSRLLKVSSSGRQDHGEGQDQSWSSPEVGMTEATEPGRAVSGARGVAPVATPRSAAARRTTTRRP